MKLFTTLLAAALLGAAPVSAKVNYSVQMTPQGTLVYVSNAGLRYMPPPPPPCCHHHKPKPPKKHKKHHHNKGPKHKHHDKGHNKNHRR